jgi:hypothetical protein
LLTATLTGPAVTSSEAGTVTTRDMADRDVGVRGVLPKLTIEDERKLLPEIVMVVSGEPAVALGGEIAVITGTGFCATGGGGGGGAGAVIVKLTEFDVPPPGFLTLTKTKLGKLLSVTMAERAVELMNVAGRVVDPKLTTAPFTKSEPVIRRKIVLPPCVAEGSIELTVGGGGVSVRVAGLDDPPPGEELIT